MASTCYASHLYQASFDIVLMSSWYSAGCGWRFIVCSENGRRSGSWSGTSEDEWFCWTCRMELWRPGALLISSVKVLSWNVFKDLFLTQISMLTAWELKFAVNGAHELFTPQTLCCQVMHRSNEKMGERKLLESEQMDCRRVVLALMASLVQMDSMGSMAAIASMAVDGSCGSGGFDGAQVNLGNPEDVLAIDGHTKRSGWIQKSQTGGQKLLESKSKDCHRTI